MFDTYRLNEAGFKEVLELKSTMALAVNKVSGLLPESREKSIFMTKLEEAMFFATRAIAMKAHNHAEVERY